MTGTAPPADPAAANPAGSPPEAAQPRRRTKRSVTVSLVLVAGAGAAALALGRIDPAQREDDALVYGTLGACIAEGLRSIAACTDAESTARERYAATAPRYDTEATCARHHGKGGCLPGAEVTEAARGHYLPVMAAYMMGRTEDGDIPVQPLYAHAPEAEAEGDTGGYAGGHAGGYCTGTGGRVAYAGGASRVSVPSSVARTTATAPRMVAAGTISRGGFGGTGRATAFSGGHSGSGGG